MSHELSPPHFYFWLFISHLETWLYHCACVERCGTGGGALYYYFNLVICAPAGASQHWQITEAEII
jgi:hypothetical protein